MKKLIVTVLISVFAISLMACSSEPKRPEDISEDLYDIGVKAVKITDKYLEADLTLDEAYDEISNLSDQASNSRNDEYSSDLAVSIEIDSIEYDLFSMEYPYGDKKTESDVKSDRNKLADTLGIK